MTNGLTGGPGRRSVHGLQPKQCTDRIEGGKEERKTTDGGTSNKAEDKQHRLDPGIFEKEKGGKRQSQGRGSATEQF